MAHPIEVPIEEDPVSDSDSDEVAGHMGFDKKAEFISHVQRHTYNQRTEALLYIYCRKRLW